MKENKQYLTAPVEKAYAVCGVKKGNNRKETQESLEELQALAETMHIEVVERIYQELPKISKDTFIGKGKVEEIRLLCKENDVKLVIFDDELSPIQLRNLTKELECRVIDRSMLILEIFVKRAKTNEAKTQVELANLQYMLPRLTRMWTHLSKQQGGGVGNKGVGETQIELDRRMIRDKIETLKEKLKLIEKQNEQKRKGREGLPKFALVGYTNTGKSTLMKVLTEEDVYIKDELFATLDTTVRSFKLPLGQTAILSDTVGFIKKLPHQLVASFRSTLAEAKDADFILQVVDISKENFKDNIDVVIKTLESLGINDKTIITVLNKVDLYPDKESLNAITEEYPNCIFISAKNHLNISNLLDLMQRKFNERSKDYVVMLPYSETKLISILFTHSELIDQQSTDAATIYNVRVKHEHENKFINTFGNFLME